MATSLPAFNTAATVYRVVGSPHEEARLRQAFGDRHDAYRNGGIPFYVPPPGRSDLKATSPGTNLGGGSQ